MHVELEEIPTSFTYQSRYCIFAFYTNNETNRRIRNMNGRI